MFHTALLMSGAEGSGWTNLIFFGAILLIFYFFIIRPQSQRQKEIQKMVDNLQKGVKARFNKSSITDVNPNQD